MCSTFICFCHLTSLYFLTFSNAFVLSFSIFYVAGHSPSPSIDTSNYHKLNTHKIRAWSTTMSDKVNHVFKKYLHQLQLHPLRTKVSNLSFHTLFVFLILIWKRINNWVWLKEIVFTNLFSVWVLIKKLTGLLKKPCWLLGNYRSSFGWF